jgi:hypothetical protein
MAIESVLRQILGMDRLSIPKALIKLEIMKSVFLDDFEDDGDVWKLKCYHEVQAPATKNNIDRCEAALNKKLPDELTELLRITNGVKLFIAPRKGQDHWSPGTRHVRYDIFGTDELVTIHQRLLGMFLDSPSVDPNISDVNYIAFCDADDGNYIATLHEQDDSGKIVFINKEYYYCPYSEEVSDLDYTLAESLEKWLELLLTTGGWGGRGEMYDGL